MNAVHYWKVRERKSVLSSYYTHYLLVWIHIAIGLFEFYSDGQKTLT